VDCKRRSGLPPVRLWHHRHNGRSLWTGSNKHRTSFTTTDNTGGEVKLCLVDNGCGLTPKSNRRLH